MIDLLSDHNGIIPADNQDEFGLFTDQYEALKRRSQNLFDDIIEYLLFRKF
jgi:hypothetical protein